MVDRTWFISLTLVAGWTQSWTVGLQNPSHSSQHCLANNRDIVTLPASNFSHLKCIFLKVSSIFVHIGYICYRYCISIIHFFLLDTSALPQTHRNLWKLIPAKLRGPHLGVLDTSNTKRDFKRDLGPVSQTGGEADARCIQMLWLLWGIDVAWCSLKIPENQYDIMEPQEWVAPGHGFPIGNSIPSMLDRTNRRSTFAMGYFLDLKSKYDVLEPEWPFWPIKWGSNGGLAMQNGGYLGSRGVCHVVLFL